MPNLSLYDQVALTKKSPVFYFIAYNAKSVLDASLGARYAAEPCMFHASSSTEVDHQFAIEINRFYGTHEVTKDTH